MIPRERVKRALNHQEPDRIPFDLGGTIITSITKNAYINLREYLSMDTNNVTVFDHVQQLPFIDEEMFKKLGIDVRPVQSRYVSTEDQEFFREGEYYYFYDRWGAKLMMPIENGHYYDWREFPINEIDMRVLDNYTWPEPDSKESFLPLKERAQELYEEGEYAIVGTAVFGGGIFEQPSRMMGMDRFLLSLALDPHFADTLMEKITELYIENCNRYLDEVGRYLDVFIYWNDVTGQNGPLISPEMYRKFVKPKDRRLMEAVKKKTDAKIFIHSCGAVKEFIPDFIDIGVDILNPVQVSAHGMDTAVLKREFGKDICFWGGGCDTQYILPQGSPEEVKEEVKRRIDDLAPGGGFIFNAIHNIQDDVPPQNIMAMIETLHEYGQY
jgi:uroporphyrinogen decarboxylase